jgi:hypothetical protein
MIQDGVSEAFQNKVKMSLIAMSNHIQCVRLTTRSERQHNKHLGMAPAQLEASRYSETARSDLLKLFESVSDYGDISLVVMHAET